jgi:hypothetical protein
MTGTTQLSSTESPHYLSPIVELYNGEIIRYDTAQTPVLGMVANMLHRL